MRRPSRTVRTALGGTIAVALALAGCAGPGSDPPGAESARSLTYWSMWNQSEPQAKILADAIKDFTADTGIQVDVQWQGREVVTKLLPTLASNAAADLVDGSVNALGPITSNDQQFDLTETYATEVPGEDKPLSQIIPEPYVKAVSSSAGIATMVPYEVLSEGVWFNSAKYPELAKSTGSWDEFVAALKRINDSGTPAVAIPSNDAYWLTLLLERTLGVDGLRELATDKTGAAWDAKGVTEALAAFDQLRPFFPKGYEGNQGSDAQNLWASGGAATYLSGTWVPSEAAPNVSDSFAFESVQLPALRPGGSTAVGANFIGFTIPATAKHSKEAAEFIAFFTQKTYADRIASEALQISPRSDVGVPKQLSSLAKALTTQELYPDQGGLARDFPDWYSTVFRTTVANFVIGQTDAASFVAESKRQTVDYLASNS